MKAITLWQPWATLIRIRIKPFETRGWATRYRGPLAIHAGKTRKGLDLCRGDPGIEQALATAGYSLDTLPLGVVVCTVRLVSCWPAEQIVAEDLADAFGDYSPGRFAWYLRAVRPLDPPVPSTGRQGLWEWRP